MMNEINLEKQAKDYQIEVVNPKNEGLRKQFNQLNKESFGFDFENWYQAGYWPDDYVPHVLVVDEKVVANVSIYLQRMEIGNIEKIYVQIGNVTTGNDYRGFGYSRILMEEVLRKYKPVTDQIFLYAHDGVKDFYAKFGFILTHEFEYSLEVKGNEFPITTVEKINLSDYKELKILEERARLGNAYSDFQMRNAYPLTMFYSTYFLKDSIYYIPNFDVIVIADYEEDIVIISEILGAKTVALEKIIQAMTKDGIKQVNFGFTPKEKEKFDINQVSVENTSLFVLKSELDITVKNHCMFPALAHT